MAKQQRSRGRGDPELEEPVVLCRDDRHKLWRLLDADVLTELKEFRSQLKQVQIGMAVLTFAVLSPKVGGPSASQVVGVVGAAIGGLFS